MILSQDMFPFLSDLKENNNREWFLDNKYRHEAIQNSIKEVIGEIILKLSKMDRHIVEEISPARCLFRIYRDIRFSKDKTPYKTWYSAGISLDGRKLEGPEYYIHIEPGASYLAVGYWRPKKEHLDMIRQEIDYKVEGLKMALKKGNYGVEDLLSEDKLKRAPAGYGVDDPNIELLKLKSFVLNQPITDEEIQSNTVVETIIDFYKRMIPFKMYIHEALGQ